MRRYGFWVLLVVVLLVALGWMLTGPNPCACTRFNEKARVVH
jgi:hypothetical protein